MGKAEFIDALRRALSGSLGSSSVNENIRYYQEYIEAQIRAGQGEQAVIERLGDPRLLAKTIIEASRNEGISYNNTQTEYEEIYEDGSRTAGHKYSGQRVFHMPGWVVLVFILFVLILILGVVSSLVKVLLPIILPIFFVILLTRFVQRR